MEIFKVSLPYGSSSLLHTEDVSDFIKDMQAVAKMFKTEENLEHDLCLCRSQKSFIKFDIELSEVESSGKMTSIARLIALFSSGEEAIMIKLST